MREPEVQKKKKKADSSLRFEGLILQHSIHFLAWGKMQHFCSKVNFCHSLMQKKKKKKKKSNESLVALSLDQNCVCFPCLNLKQLHSPKAAGVWVTGQGYLAWLLIMEKVAC